MQFELPARAFTGVSGSYQYVDAAGKLQTVNYVADHLGFRVQDSRIPVHVAELPEAPVHDAELPVAPVHEYELPVAPVYNGVAPVAPVYDGVAPEPVAGSKSTDFLPFVQSFSLPPARVSSFGEQ